METAPLKSFAAWARAALIREVAARISVVLAPASPEQIEQRTAVAALVKAVNAAGGGGTGRAAVADKVAYTWFNRIIALRFMDANGYTGIGVVSPERGREGGQPEVLAEAKRGNLDSTVITNTRTAETVTSLLNSTRRSDDPQGEAYSLLLAEYCRHWNRSMPFMFEREGDYTELLMPANLLADDSVLARAVTVLTEDVCQDVEVIGWLYQFYISERKDEVFAGIKKNKKAGAEEIPAATQLFTPHWIVRYLVENSVGRLWMLNHPGSHLVDQMDYYIAPTDDQADFLKITSPEELTVIDPACGSGHMLTYAFDLLYTIYEEEGYAPSEIPAAILTRNLYGTEIDPRAAALAAFALTMKARARHRRFFAKQTEPNICVLNSIAFTPAELGLLITKDGDRYQEEKFWNQFQHASTLGSLIQPDASLIDQLHQHIETTLKVSDDLLSGALYPEAARVLQQAQYLQARYTTVVANPPYMGGRSMDTVLANFAKEEYANSKADLFSMFIERALSLLTQQGLAAMITMQGWAFLSSFTKLREAVLAEAKVHLFAHLGPRAFDSIGGEVVTTAAFVLEEAPTKQSAGTYICLTDGRNEAEKSATLRTAAKEENHSQRYEVDPDALSTIPGKPLSYWVTEGAVQAIAKFPTLGEAAKPRQGLATSDNDRFLKQWWEPAFGQIGFEMPDRPAAQKSRRRWFPCQKGGPFRKWYGNHSLVVNWHNDGKEMIALATEKYGSPSKRLPSMDFYFRQGGTWSTISANTFAMRYSPTGFISETKGAMCFADDEATLKAVIAYANSTSADYFLGLTSPTLDFHEGPVSRLPFDPAVSSEVIERASRCIEIARADWDSREDSWDFQRSPFLHHQFITTQALAARYELIRQRQRDEVDEVRGLEATNNAYFADHYGISGDVEVDVAAEDVALFANSDFTFSHLNSADEREAAIRAAMAADLVSYAVGCILGRYSLDTPGLVLADRASSMVAYQAKVPEPSFLPDEDNVIPVLGGDWFEGDIVARFRQFLRAAFGEEQFEENLRFVTESLGVKDLRDYFVKSFYKDHVQRYKKRPIYWMFSSPKGSFNALIYMHRYTPSTISTVLNEYLREYKAKLEASRQHHERLSAGAGTPREKAAAQKEVDRLRKVLLELDEYEHDVLYPLATQQVQIDLDDGVKANYPKFGAALKKIPGLEANNG
ncbi:BREX-1 system adenine-specific DNA-methyltransferase PglX [Streptomyces sp. NPDC005562]|uniref:BREX-1 system adenine-specific DNA-methyltransferase PglX n=1 Tax=Streptomyces sp. NPDC005562 TaxID=3154890 RepID=UPI0033B1100C